MPARRRKAIVSFISYDQDNFDFKKADKSFIESFKLAPEEAIDENSKNTQENRLRIWRPSVALAQLKHPALGDEYEEMAFDEYYLLYDDKSSHKDVIDNVIEDIEHVIDPKRTTLVKETHTFSNPWNTREVYDYLVGLGKEKLSDSSTDYYFNCTAGTTAMRNCLFLLTQTGQLKGLRLAPTPWKNHKQRGRKKEEKKGYTEDGRRTPTGSYTIEDPAELWDSYERSDDKEPKSTLRKLTRGIVTQNATMVSCLEKLAHLTECLKNMNRDNKFEHPILLTGETGVGKSILAENIKDELKLEGNFVSINCATIGGGDPNITRAALFGCKKGIISGLEHDMTGALEKADKGVLFLDEIGELDLQTQAALLTAIETHKFVPLSGDPSSPVQSSFQLVCGTNQDLDELVRTKRFRFDLLNRINMWHFNIPPLRDRKGDIDLNCRAYLGKIGKAYGKQLQLAPDAEKELLRYCEDENTRWDGNFREFNAMLTRLVVLSFGSKNQRDVKISLDQVEAEIKHAKECQARRMMGITRAEESDAAQPAETAKPAADFPVLREILSEGIEKIPLPNRPWLEYIASLCRRRHFATQQELSEEIFGADGKSHSGTLSKQLKNAGLKFHNGRIEASSGAKQAPKGN